MLKIRQLQKKKQEEAERLAKSQSTTPTPGDSTSTSNQRVSPAQIRVQKDISELDLPSSIRVTFPNPNDLFNFNLQLIPQAGYYKNGNSNLKLK